METVQIKSSRIYICTACQQPLAECFCLASQIAKPVNGGDPALSALDLRAGVDSLLEQTRRSLDAEICRALGLPPDLLR